MLRRLCYIAALFMLMQNSCSKIETGEYHFELNASENDTVFFSLFSDSISYIDLETTDSCIIRDCSDLVIANHNLLLWDKKQKCIWIFDTNGRFKNCLNKMGNGSDEYTHLSQFEYNPNTNEILVLDAWTKQIIHYDLNCRFLCKEEIDIYANDFKVAGDNYLLSNLGSLPEYSGIFFYDHKSKSSKKIIGKTDNIPWNDVWELINWHDTVACAAAPFNNLLYQFKGSNIVDTLSITVPRSTRQYGFTESPFEYEDFLRTSYLESNKWVWMTFWKHDRPIQNIFINKSSGDSFAGSVVYNDIDSIDRICSFSYSEGNVFTFAVEKDQGKNPSIQILHLK